MHIQNCKYLSEVFCAIKNMSNQTKCNNINVKTFTMENINNKEKMEEEKDDDKGSSNTATGSHVQCAVNDSYQAVTAKY